MEKLRRFAGVTLSVVEGGSPQPKSRALFARDLDGEVDYKTAFTGA
jgi:hypothetical protein